jgi:hypothetical protein
VNFQEYLISKKIDEAAFAAAEPLMFSTWKSEFEQVHPNSFTVQKLNLINPVRRRFTLKVIPPSLPENPESSAPLTPPQTSTSASPKPVAKPMIRPKPKMS